MQFGVIIPDNSQKIIKTNFIRIDTKKDVYFLATERRQDYTEKAFGSYIALRLSHMDFLARYIRYLESIRQYLPDDVVERLKASNRWAVMPDEIKGFLGAVEVIKEGQAEGVKSQKGVIGQVCIAVLPIEYQRHHKSPGETVYCIGDDIF